MGRRELYVGDRKLQVKSRRMIWTGHAAHMGEKRNAYRFVGPNQKGKRLLDRTRRKREVLSSSGYGPMEGSCEHGNEHSGVIKF